MKSLRFYLQFVSILCVLAFFVGCGTQIQKADKLAMSDPKSAVASYELVMKTKPGTEEAKQAHLKMADTYYKQMNDPQKGLEVYAEIVKTYPKTKYSAEAEKAIGMHYYQAKEYDKAIEAFNKAAEEAPDTEIASDSIVMVGKSYEDAKKYEDAVKTYLDFSKNHPTHRLAAKVALTSAKIYQDQLDLQDEAIETYKFVASKFSLSASAMEARDALKNLGVDAAEIPTLESQAAAGTPGSAQVQEEPKVQAQIGTRTRRRASNAPPPDISSIKKTTGQGTQSTTPQGPQNDAAQQMQSRTVSPDFGVDPMDLMPAGMTSDEQGTMYDAMYSYAGSFIAEGKYKEAGALFEKALQLVGNKPWNNAASAYYLLGKSYRGIGNNEKATQMFREAIKRDSKVIDNMIREGATQYGEEEYDKALYSYKTALGLVPYRDWEIYYNMGLVYIKLKDADKELDAFERSVALKPNDNIDALQHLAEVLYYRKNNPARATLFDSEAKGLGNNDYKVQKEIADLCFQYNSYSWSSTKYGNGMRVVASKINDELKKSIGTGEEATKISADLTKIDLKMVMDAATAGNTKAIDALKKVDPMIADYRFMIARRALSQTRNKQYVDAQKLLDESKVKEPGIVNSAEYQFALGELNVNPDNKQANKEVGIAALKKAIEIDPQHQGAAAKLKELGL
jgi:tetratricopeptide (TPR) repeat protein